MGADGVEVTQKRNAVLGMGGGMVGQNAFRRLFGPTIRRGRVLEVGTFRDRYVLGFAIDRATRRKHDVVDVVRSCDFQERSETADVVGGVFGGLMNAFPHRFVRSEVEDALDRCASVSQFIKDARELFSVPDVHLKKWNVCIAQVPNTFHGLHGGIVKIVEQQWRKTRLMQGHRGVASNVSSPACYQNVWSPCRFHGTNLHLAPERVTFS